MHAVPVPVPARPHDRQRRRRSLLAAAVGGVYALVVGLPLMRLSGLAAGIATFGVLEITHNLLRYYDEDRARPNTFSLVPETTGLLQAAIGALIVIAVAFGYQRSRFGRLLRATREDAGSRAGGRRLRPSPAAVGVRALGRAGRASRAGCTSTCCRSTRERSTSI